MAFKGISTDRSLNKLYLWRSVELGNGLGEYIYVTADANTVVEVSGYFDSDDIGEHVETMRPGDRVWVYTVGAIDDTRSISADIAAALVDVSLHVVLQASGAGISISSDILVATITYTS